MRKRLVLIILLGALVTGGLVLGGVIRPFAHMAMSMADLVDENAELRTALANLTAESPIGHAKVVAQERRDGALFTTVRFAAVDRDDPTRVVLERTHTIRGDVFYVDLLVVRFPGELVADGRARSLYLWRRLFGAEEAPSDGVRIEEPGSHPQRYHDLSDALGIDAAAVFWDEVWSLANHPHRLRELGIEAIDGKAAYRRYRPGLIYTFALGSDGAITTRVTPDL